MKLRLILYWLVKNNKKVFKRCVSNPLGVATSAGDRNMNERKLKKMVKNEQTGGRRIWKLKENNMKARFRERVKE